MMCAMATRLTGWRKLAGSAWGPPNDPQFFGELDIDASALLSYVEALRAATGVRVTITHLVGRAVAYALTEVPEFQVRLARGRAHPRESVDVFYIVSADGGRELTGLKIAEADRKSLVEVAEELNRRAAAASRGEDDALGRTTALMSALPPWLLRRVLDVGAWLSSDLNLDLSRFGMPRQAFGSAMITSIGMWGVSRAFSPLARYYRCPLLVLVGAVEPRPVVVDNEVVVRHMLTLTATVDHRYADGFHAVKLAQAVRRYCADPAAHEPATAALAEESAR